MKVYGINHFVGGRQRYVIVAAKSKAAAVRALNAHRLMKTSMYWFSGWAHETVNPMDVEVAMSQPGRAFHTSVSRHHKSADEYALVPLREEVNQA